MVYVDVQTTSSLPHGDGVNNDAIKKVSMRRSWTVIGFNPSSASL